ncbi:MAG: O-methyltransferase [Clostridia bacterium]|jgi:predicted O-methyltransferase YrrM|uniref:O-methyltransferase n=1 Tax=Pumilibacter muris TaxID=2941510 RepID=UPI00203C82BA|nr:O-methyltransferase [Pumilibacter muris]MCI8595671.1 O-methyltransferase [Clostridia bacterium]
MPFKTPGKTSEYIRELLSLRAADEVERKITDYADKNIIAVLLPETTAFLRQAVMLKKPLRILEIGTAIGYSGIVMLRAALPETELYTVEMSEERIATAKEFFRDAGLLNNVVFYVGDSTEIVPNLKGKFDFIFLDGPKAQYCEYLPFLSRLLNKGGVLFCDNVLYEGMVSGEREIKNHKGGLVKKLDLFLHKLMEDGSLLTSVLPVGDGVSLSVKTEESL